MPLLSAGPVTLHYERSGDGPPLILIPGWTLNLHLWDETVRDLGGRFDVIRYDPRGAGRSTADPRLEFSRPADAEDLLGLMDGLGLTAAHLVGHSKGARIAAVFAMTHPGRVLSLTCLGSAEPHGPSGEPSFRPIASAWAAKARELARSQGPEAALRSLSGARLFGKIRANPDGMRRLRSAMEGYRAADLLSEVPARAFDTSRAAEAFTMPVHYVCGEEDPFLSECRGAHAAVRGSRLTVLPRCGHMAPIERPAELAAAIAAFS